MDQTFVKQLAILVTQTTIRKHMYLHIKQNTFRVMFDMPIEYNNQQQFTGCCFTIILTFYRNALRSYY